MSTISKKVIAVILVLAMTIGIFPIASLAAPSSNIVTAYMYYKINGQIPIENNKVQYNDTTAGNYGPSGDNTPMLAVDIDLDKLEEAVGVSVQYGTGSWGYPEWYYRPMNGSDAAIQAYWNTVLDCMTPESRASFEATGMSANFIGYMLKRNIRDTHGYNVHLDGILNVSTEDNTKVYVCELYDNTNTYIGGLVTDSTKDPAENPTIAGVLDIYETSLGLAANTTWTHESDGSYSVIYRDAENNRHKAVVKQSISGSYKPHDSGEIGYSQPDSRDNKYFLASFKLTKTALPYSVTYQDGMGNTSFQSQVYNGLLYGVATPSFIGGTPEDPEGKKVFDGWTPAVAPTVTGDSVYVAQWKDATYTVTWYDENGETVLERDLNVPNGTTPTYDGPRPSKAGDAQYHYDFLGWAPVVSPVAGADQSYRAVYAPVLNEYTVTWVDENSTLLEKDENVKYGELPTYNDTNGTTANLAASKTNAEYTYRFLGWAPAVSAVTGDITYTATYEKIRKTYTVTWVDHNGNPLEVDTVYYNGTVAYNGEEPQRTSTAMFHYSFKGWLNEDGVDTTVYDSDGAFPAVTKNVVYQAQYDAVERRFTVTLNLKLDGVLVDSETIHGVHSHPYISADGQTFYEGIDDPSKGVGVHTFQNVPNGTYRIYVRDNNGYRIACDQIIVMESADIVKECNYYSVTYNGNGATGGVPAKTGHHLGKSVSVSAVPTRDGYIFKGWKVDDTATVLMPNGSDSVLLTNNITKAYVLTAQWVKAVDIKVNVHIDHRVSENENDGYDISEGKDEVEFELLWRPQDGTAPWLEVANSQLNLSKNQYTGFNASFADEYSNYIANTVTYSNVEGEGRQFSLVFRKNGYTFDSSKGNGTGIQVTEDSDGNYTLDLYLKYSPNNFDLQFSVQMAPNIPSSLYPDAVIVRVLCWDGDSWEIITQQNDGKPGVGVNISKTDGKGTGFYSVWQKAPSSLRYYYRFEVSAFVYGGKIVPYTGTDLVEYTDGTYTATMQDVTGGLPPVPGATSGEEALYGAYYHNGTQNGTLVAVISVDYYHVVLDGNGGSFAGDSKKELCELLNMPNISGFVPTRTDGAYTFDGFDWYVDTNGNKLFDAGVDTPASALPEGAKLANSYILVARWKAPWKVEGKVNVAGTYILGSDEKYIQDADRIANVTVILEYAPKNSTVFTAKQSFVVSIQYNDKLGVGDYYFENLPNDGGTWRIRVLNHNYTETYQNEASADFASATAALNSPSVAIDSDSNAIAKVDVQMVFNPELFDLYFKVDADQIGDGFKPSGADVFVTYDDDLQHSDSALNWPVISQMQVGGGGANPFVYEGVYVPSGTEKYYSVWIRHPNGYLYDYSIRLQNVGGVALTGNEPFTVVYNGSAEYLQSGGYRNQTKLLCATLIPKTYAVRYYLEQGSTVEIMAMGNGATTVKEHTWSYATALKNAQGWLDVPTRAGKVFAGWVDENGNPVTSIAASVSAETKLYATWEEDNWADGDYSNSDQVLSDSRTGGDGIPDRQQICIEYVTDGKGSLNTLFEIVTITGSDFSDISVGVNTNRVNGSTATAMTDHALDQWEFVGSSMPGDNAVNVSGLNGTQIVTAIQNADGGTTYVFRATFDEDHWRDADMTPDPNDVDAPHGGDGILDRYQAEVHFISANENQGLVSGNVYQVTTFDRNTGSGSVVPSLNGVVVTGNNGFAFDYWTKDSGTNKLSNSDVVSEITNVAGGTVITFYAHFAIDEWNDVTNRDDEGDGIPDYKQVLVEYVAASNGRGTVSGKDSIQVFTLTEVNAMGKYFGNITPQNTNLTVTANDGFAFDYWGDLRGFWGPSGSKLTDEKPFSLHENVVGGSIIVYVAHFEADVWNGGDDIPDYQQILIVYRSEDESKGTVSLGSEVVTLTNPELAEDISADRINGTSAIAKSGFAFDYWYQNKSNVSFDDRSAVLDPSILQANGGDVYTFTAVFNTDTVGGGENGEEPDNVPDQYQKKIIFKVVNGTWADDTAAEIVKYVTLKTDGEWDVNGTATVDAMMVPTGMKANAGFKNGTWDASFPVTVSGTEAVVYTHSFVRSTTPLNPTDTVKYVVEHYKANANGSYPTDPTETELFGGIIGSTVTASAKQYSGYCWNPLAAGTVANGTLVKIEDSDDIVVLKLYYDTDTVGGGENGEEPDQIPDQYQKKIIFKVVNGTWANDTAAEIVKYVTLMTAGKWDSNGTATVDATMAPAGMKANVGFKNGTWDASFPVTVSGTEAVVYTHSFVRSTTPLNPTDTVKYIVEHYKANANGSYPTDPTETELFSGIIGSTVTASAKQYSGYCWNPLAAGTVLQAELVRLANAEDIVVLKLYYDADTVGGGENGEEPDNIPDQYQKKIIFKVVNGTWADDIAAEIVKYVTLMTAGKWDINGTATVDAMMVPTGMKANAGFKNGTWDASFPVTVSGTEAVVYTHSFARSTTPVNPTDTVKYIVEHYKANANGSYPTDPTETELFSGIIGSTVTASAKQYSGYCWNPLAAGTVTGGTLVKIEDSDDIVVLKLYYDADTVGGGKNGGEPDQIPDKFQKKIIFKVVNGTWADGTTAEIVKYVTLMTNGLRRSGGVWDVNGTAVIDAQLVPTGMKANAGFKNGAWNETFPVTVSGTDAVVYTYTFERSTTPVNPTDTVKYFVEHYKANANGSYPTDPTETELFDGIIGSTVTAVAKQYSGYCWNPLAAGTVTGGTLVKIEDSDDIVVLKLYYDTDTVGGGKNGEEPDQIPDQYQKKIIFKVVNGTWADGTTAEIVKYVTLMTAGKWDINGTATLDATLVPAGMKANEGYENGAWDVIPPQTVSGTKDETFIHRFVEVPTTPDTSDRSKLWLWLSLMIASGAGAFGLNWNDRKRRAKNR